MDKAGTISISGKTGEVMQVQPMTLFVYADEHKETLLSTVRVEIHSRHVIYTRVKLGETSNHTLSLAAAKARTVRIYSNKTNVVFQSSKQQGKNIRLIPGSMNHFSVLIQVITPERLLVPTIVNCVDVNTDELVHSWLLIVEAL